MKKLNLTNEQRTAINELDRNLQIVACAGSGKTEVISQRIANIIKSRSDIAPNQIVAFTFTEKAAESLKSRIESSIPDDMMDVSGQMYIGTIHGFCWHLLSHYSSQYAGFSVLDTVKLDLFLMRYHAVCGLDDWQLSTGLRDLRLFSTCIDKLIDDYDNRETWEEINRTVFDKYFTCLHSHHYLDFSLLIHEVLQILDTNPAMNQYLSSIRYLTVDEYQDVDDLQEKLIYAIAERGANICVVGDDDQTVYQFRGSNAENMISFPQRHEGVHTVHLNRNFRCGKRIIDVADAVIKNNRNRIEKQMKSGNDNILSKVQAIRFYGGNQWAGIRDLVSERHKEGISYDEMAILVRKGKFIAPIVSALSEAGIPVKSNSAENFFRNPYVIAMGETIQLLSSFQPATLSSIWDKYLDNSAITSGFRALRRGTRNAQQSLPEILQEFCNASGLLDETHAEYLQRKSAMEGLCQILSDYEEIYGDWQLSARISGVMRFMDRQVDEEYKYHDFPGYSQNDGVQVMTIHKSKGLEFDTVIIPKLEEHEFPAIRYGDKQFWHVLGDSFAAKKAKYQSSVDDERKLFYVAVTRAKHRLYFTYELSKKPVSPFVIEASATDSLYVDPTDLTYKPEPEPINERKHITDEQREQWAREKEERHQYWELVKAAKHELYEYYGTAGHFFKGAYGELERIKTMSPDEIIVEARLHGLV